MWDKKTDKCTQLFGNGIAVFSDLPELKHKQEGVWRARKHLNTPPAHTHPAEMPYLGSCQTSQLFDINCKASD